MAKLPPDSVLAHVVDVHCHPTDSPTILTPESIENLKIQICAMSSRASDQSLVRDLALSTSRVTPCFGYHPWFTHFIKLDDNTSKEEHYRSLFPSTKPEDAEAFAALLAVFREPISLSSILAEVRENLQAFPNAMLGEVGLDGAFRVPYDYDATPRRLTPFTVPLSHQLAILEAQFGLAMDLGRNISLHSVKAPQPTVDLLQKMLTNHGERWQNINIDLHSCGLSPEVWKSLQNKHGNTYLSLSTVINSRSPKTAALIEACAHDRLLVESDYNDISKHTEQTWDMIEKVAEARGWPVENEWVDDLPESDWGVVRRLEDNWIAFKTGKSRPPPNKRQKWQKEEQWWSDSDEQA